LHALKGLLRSSLATCLITVPVLTTPNSTLLKLEHLADYAVKLESFAGIGAKVSDVFSEYDGLFFVRKLPRLNSLVCHLPETLKYVFRQGRRKLHLEIPHLGPEESRTSSKPEAPKKTNVPSLLCAPGPVSKSALDF
jgi:hypothetical protein